MQPEMTDDAEHGWEEPRKGKAVFSQNFIYGHPDYHFIVSQIIIPLLIFFQIFKHVKTILAYETHQNSKRAAFGWWAWLAKPSRMIAWPVWKTLAPMQSFVLSKDLIRQWLHAPRTKVSQGPCVSESLAFPKTTVKYYTQIISVLKVSQLNHQPSRKY